MMNLKGELVSFISKDKLILNGFLFHSTQPSKGVIIHIHGMTGSFYDTFTMNIATRFAKSGFDFFPINTRGANKVESFEGEGRRKDETIGTVFEDFKKCIYDIEGAIDFCRKRGYKKIVLQGHSTGCQKITYYQAVKNDKRVSALILLAPADDINLARKKFGKKLPIMIKIAKRLLKKKHPYQRLMPFGIYGGLISAERFLSFADEKNAEAQLFDYIEGKLSLFRKIRIPILAIFGSKEQYRTMPVAKYLEMLRNATKSKKFNSLKIKGANHSFGKTERILVERILNWLENLES